MDFSEENNLLKLTDTLVYNPTLGLRGLSLHG